MQVELKKEYSSVNAPLEDVTDARLGAEDNEAVSRPDGQNINVHSWLRPCKPMRILNSVICPLYCNFLNLHAHADN